MVVGPEAGLQRLDVVAHVHPSIAAITGLGHDDSGHQTSDSCASPRTPRVSPGTVFRSARSVPAQNDPPDPVTMTTRAASSVPARRTASMNSASIANVIALRF